MSLNNIAANTSGRHTVAVPDSDEKGALYHLGVKGETEGAKFVLGDKGPSGQRLATIYVTAEDSFMSINLDEGTITVISGKDETLQAVTYDIDAQVMQGTEVEVGETLSVTFTYDNKLFDDETPVVSEWLATTGAQYPDLSDRLESDNTVVDFNSMIADAKRNRRFGRSSRAPRSASEVTALHHAILNSVSVEVDVAVPEAVQTYDPVMDKHFVGRIWEHAGQETTARELQAAGYRFAAVEFVDGKKGVLLFNFKGGLGIQIKSHQHMIERVLAPEAMDSPLGNGKRFDTTAISSFDGDTSQAGRFASPDMSYVVGVASEVGHDAVDYRKVGILEDFRGTTQTEFDLTH